MNSNEHLDQSAPKPQTNSTEDLSKPVAYDNQGRPLYAHPAATNNVPPQMVYVARPHSPEAPYISEEVRRKAEESHKKYSNLNLSNGEYVIAAVRRHPIGLVQIWLAVIIMIIAVAGSFSMFLLSDNSPLLSVFGNYDAAQSATMALIALATFVALLGGLAATYIYENNRFYLTNESVIQEVQTGLFRKYEQTVSLSNIEDASYAQSNPLQLILSYGSIRLSTEGDETTYRFSYVANPKKHIAMLNNAVEAFKNGRPID